MNQSGNNLLITKLGTNDQIAVANWYTGAGHQVQQMSAGGYTIDSQIATLISAMASYASANPSFNPTTATSMPTDTTLQSAITAAWHT